MENRDGLLFPVAGIVAIVMVALIASFSVVPEAMDAVAGGPGAGTQAPAIVAATVAGALALLLALFGWMFWMLVGRGSRVTPLRAYALIALQLGIVFLTVTDLFYVLSAEIGFVLPARRGWLALGAMFAVFLGYAGVALWDGSFEPSAELRHAPWLAQVVLTIVQMSAWCFFAFAVGRLAARERRNRERLQGVNLELESAQHLLADASRLAERVRISRELHDSLGHHLTGLNVNLQLASHLAEGRAAEPVRHAHTVAKLLLQEVREVVSSMRAEPPAGLDAAIEALVRNMHRPIVYTQLPPAPAWLSPTLAHVLYRCAQEALTNTARHSEASNVWVTVRYLENQAELEVRDDGRGTRMYSPGNGLRGMEERLVALGGRLEIDPSRKPGFRLVAVVPRPGGEPAIPPVHPLSRGTEDESDRGGSA